MEVKDAEGCTPLAYAACRGRVDVVRLLLKSGANLEAPDYFDNTILMYAVTSTDPSLVAFIIKKEMDGQ